MKVSIGIPFFNAELYFEDAIKSVIQQSFKEWELILLDDGSTDSSLNIAKYYAKIDGRIRVISDGMNKRLPYRLNQLIKLSKYDYIARMDADDLIHPKRLEIQYDFLTKNTEFDLVSSGLASIDMNNQVKGIRCVKSLVTNFNNIERHYPIVHASILAKKSWYQRNQYDIDMPRSQDYELWCRAIYNKDFKIAVISDVLYYYREEGLVTYEKLLRSYRDSLKVYRKYSNSLNIKVYILENFKIAIIFILGKLGFLQHLIKFRNKEKVDSSIISYHQEIVNKILLNE